MNVQKCVMPSIGIFPGEAGASLVARCTCGRATDIAQICASSCAVRDLRPSKNIMRTTPQIAIGWAANSNAGFQTVAKCFFLQARVRESPIDIFNGPL